MSKNRGLKREKDIKYKKYLKFLCEIGNWYPSPVYLKTFLYSTDKPTPITPYYKRLYKGNHKNNRYSYYKKHANRQVRRYKGDIQSGGMYKKIFDYWWTVD